MSRALVWVGVLGGLLAILLLVEGLRYPRGTAGQPGPGLFPVLVSVLLLVSSVGLTVEAVRDSPRPAVGRPPAAARWRLVATLTAAVGYVMLLPILGHRVAGALAVLAILRVMRMQSWVVSAVLAVSLAVGSHYLFVVLLGVPLPPGVWSE